MNLIKTAIFIIIAMMVAKADLSSSELIFLPWGDKDNEIGIRQAPDGQFGPMSFAVKNDKIIILDSQNKKLKIFQQKKLNKSVDLPSVLVDDFAWISEKSYYLLRNNRVDHYSGQKIKNSYQTDSPQNLITALRIVNNQPQLILNESASSKLTSGKNISYSESKGIENQHGHQIMIQKQNWNKITVNTDNGTSFKISSTNNDLGLARFLGSTPSGDIYLYLEKIVQHVPLVVKREIDLYSRSGNIKTVIEVPLHMHTYIFSEFYVDEKGNLFHMITSEKGVYILGWYLNDQKEFKKNNHKYPDRFQRIYHYNNIETGSPDRADESKETQSSWKFDPVTRDESLDIGHTYVQHQWTATADNITNGLIQDPNGVYIETPSWVQVGQNTKVPYKWGGFNTLAGFDNGIAGGKYAGDKATGDVSSYCVGVDCSGFVSRCWKLPSHYSTRMMDDFITVAYNGWYELQPADAIHKVGHVRMFVAENANGSLLTVEAAGADWRVSYRSFNLSQLYAYTPRYYIYMQGSPATIPRAQLNTLIFSDSVYMHWTFDDTTAIAGFHLYANITGNSWVYAPGGELIPPGRESASFQLTQQAAIFFKAACVSASNNLLEGYPTDVYGYYNSGGNEKVLIVDGFDRTDGSYNAPYHEFARVLGKTIASHQVAFETADNDAVSDGEIMLDNYEAVFWLLGDESTDEETFNNQEQQLVRNYLLQGGKIFVSGSEIAWDLDYKGSSSDKTFIHNVLKTRYDQDDSQSYIVNGVAGTALEGLSIHFDDGTHGVYEEDYPDAYLTNGGSYALMKYNNGLIAATAFEGTLNGGTAPAQIFMMGFPFETIYAEADKYDFMEKLLGYFNLHPTSIEISDRILPEQPVLFDNYPNPFNPATTIKFQISDNQFINLQIFNVLGQKITTLVSGKLTPGIYQYQWDASEQAGGVYYYVLKKTSGFKQTKKMVLLR